MPRGKPHRPAPLERFIDPRKQPFTFGRSRGTVPHLYKQTGTYFVTFCLEDAVPEHVRKRRSLKNETDTDVIAGYSEPPIREGVCLLNLPESARVVEDALLHFQGQRYDLHAWVVMPNHVHVVVSPHDGFALSGVLHSWKSFSANQINRMLGRKEKLWQAESFDHLVRSEDAYARFVAYTEQNPVRAGLCSKPDDWLFSSARYR